MQASDYLKEAIQKKPKKKNFKCCIKEFVKNV